MIQWLNTNTGSVMAGLTLAYVICTLLMCVFAWRANRTALDMHAAVYRPVVVCDFFTQHSVMYFRIRNVGMRHAENVRISVTETPPLKDSEDKWSRNSVVVNGISFLSPGSEIVTLYSLPQQSELATVCFVITYCDGQKRQFTETSVINLQAWLHEDLGRENNDPVVQKLEKIAGALSKMGKMPQS